MKWVIVVPEDKKQDIIQLLQKTMRAKKVTVKHLQSLADKLNFITKAVPQGSAFSARIYHEFKDLRPRWHISVAREMCKDLQMWLCFLEHFEGAPQSQCPLP